MGEMTGLLEKPFGFSIGKASYQSTREVSGDKKLKLNTGERLSEGLFMCPGLRLGEKGPCLL